MVSGKLGVFGLGYQDLSAALKNDFPWKVAGLLVLGKLVTTIVSYASGGCGGIFVPSLFFGGMSGFFIAGLFSRWVILQPSDQIILTAVGMTACLGAVVRAPLTSL
jgi:CIC family chloride channel protein